MALGRWNVNVNSCPLSLKYRKIPESRHLTGVWEILNLGVEQTNKKTLQ